MSWSLVALSELLSDVQPGFASGENVPNGVLQIRMNNVKPDGSWDWSKERRVPATDKQLKKYSVEQGDILFNATNSPEQVGKSALFQGAEEPVAFSNHFLRLKTNKSRIDANYLTRYFGYLWKQREFENMVDAWVNQATVQRDSFLALRIPVPPLEEQKRIAAILDKADIIRRKRQQAIQLADEFLRAVFLELFGDPVANSKGWEVKKLKDLSTKILSGTTPNGGKENYVDKGIMFFRSQNVWKRKILLEDIAYIDEQTHKKMSNSSLKHKDILMTKTGRFNTENSSLGRASMFLGEDDSANINGHVYLIRLNSNVINEFVLYILTTNEYRDYIRSVCVGGIDKRQINKEHLEEFPIIQPSLEAQKDFSKCMRIVETMKEKAMRSLKESDDLFNALSQKAFAGKL